MFQNMVKTKFKMAAASEELFNVDLQLELEINKDDFLTWNPLCTHKTPNI